jgi:Fic family protein
VPYRPPFEISPRALASVAEIMRLVGRYEGLESAGPEPMLVRKNRIRTVAGSLAIEGNVLGEEQITAILDRKRVVAPKRDILEAKNAIEAYQRAVDLDPASERDLLRAHGILLRGLASDASRFRVGSVGVFRGSRVAHVAPPPREVGRLVRRLLDFVRHGEAHPLVASAVAHYELAFIHPFSDGNGRVARLWQHVILSRWNRMFEAIPIESIVRSRQQEYYRVLRRCDRAGSSTAFVELSLLTIERALEGFFSELSPSRQTSESRLELARASFGAREFSRKEYRALFARLSTATASRDLLRGVEASALERRGTKALARYRFVRKRRLS